VNTRAQSLLAWRAAHQKIGTGGVMTIPKTAAFPHPRDAGAVPTATWPVGQIADYVLELELGSPPLLIREFSNRFEAVVAGIALAQRAIAIAEANPTTAMYMGGILLGAAIGTAVTNKPQGALVGAGIGLLIAVLMHSRLQQDRPPA
jgi:hypothetical protein